ncbi:hypothetical protein PG985_004332 [Apiospora marii]|uniref:uncharacterized protein n=1 Tax=Apiospora marii TaxID=335849 RepID=UPI0031309D20
MPVDAECFVIHPFQELVRIAKEAAANAEAGQSDDPERSKRMLKSARGLVKEGERALQKIQPLWDAQVDKHGDAFKRGITDNDADVENRRILEDLLYDLDDFIEVDTFDADKYSEVQAASKAFALSALEAIRRLKIDDHSSTMPSSSESMPLASHPTNTVFPPLPPLPPGRYESFSRPLNKRVDSSPASASTSRKDSQRTSSTTRTSGKSALGGGHVLERVHTVKSHTSSANSANSSGSVRSSVSSRRSDQSPLHSVHPVHPGALQPARSKFNKSDRPSPVRADADGQELTPSQLEIGPEMAYMSPTPRISEWVRDQLSTSLPTQTEVIADDVTLPHRHAGRPATSTSSRDTLVGSELPDYDSAGPTSSGSTSYRTSVFSEASSRLSTAKGGLHVSFGSTKIPPLPTRFFNVFPAPSSENLHGSTLRPVGGVKAASRECLVGIPTPAPEMEPWYANRAKCTIGIESSFKTMGGFCEGAFIFREEGGQAATIAGLEQGNKVTVARCVECKYRHTLSAIELDSDPRSKKAPGHSQSTQMLIEGIESGGLCAWGVRYRLRFLYKSHLPSEYAHVTRYGCSDATVFTTPDQLFRHLARHPQPLPELEEFPVAYGELSPEDIGLGNFDLVFSNPQTANPLAEVDPTTFGSLPTAVAITDHLVRPGDRMNVGPDGENTMQFLEGARILGVEFPEKWGGKQCVGWHDGARGSFPARCISLLPPPKGNVRIPGMNNDGVTFTARWKWEPSDPGSGWLSFDKGATIRNVSWLDQNQWCWSGMTKDGKVGFFPQSHIKPEWIKAASSPDSNQFLKQGRPTKLFYLRRTLSHAP